MAQDLYLARLAVTIARHPVAGKSLIWRGGTCLHQLHLETPRRYSEDLDYVLRPGQADYAALDDAFKEIAADVGIESSEPEKTKTAYRRWFEVEGANADQVLRIKLEVNTADAEPRLEPLRLRLEVPVGSWFDGSAEVLTFQAAELLGTKFRALAQRRKGRDLWDLTTARRPLQIDDEALAECAAHYLGHEGISPEQLRQRLAGHVADPEFVSDLDPLVVGGLADYDAVATALSLIAWTDLWLDDHLPTAAHQRRDKEAPSRCPVYTMISGNPSRCVNPNGECSDHPGAASADW